MANNVTIDNGALTDFIIATDEIASVHYQIIKLAFGADDTATLTSSANPLPVSVPVASRTSDSVAVAQMVDAFMQATTPRNVVWLPVNASTSGNNTLLAAQGAGNKIQVHGGMLIAASGVTVTFQSGAGGTGLTGPMPFGANSGFAVPNMGVGIMGPTAANTLLNMVLGAAVQVGGVLAYTVIT